MTPVKREELPELPNGWGWIVSDHGSIDTWDAELVVGCQSVRCVGVNPVNGQLWIFENGAGEVREVPMPIVLAVLFANGVTLPEVPCRSSLLGWK